MMKLSTEWYFEVYYASNLLDCYYDISMQR